MDQQHSGVAPVAGNSWRASPRKKAPDARHPDPILTPAKKEPPQKMPAPAVSSVRAIVTTG